MSSKKLFGLTYMVIIILAVLALLYGCREKPIPVVNVPETITAQAKPVEDYLRKEIAVLKDSITALKAIAAKASVKKEVAREKKQDASAKVNEAEKKGDSLAIINSLKDEVLADEQYIKSADEQAAVQGKIIVKQDRIITNQLADIELQKSKFNELATAFTNLNNQYGQAIKELKKSERKLKRAKTLNKILGIGTAAGVGLAAIIFL